jgi:hypothetical protein
VRVAALYDVHGNLPALEAVLADPLDPPSAHEVSAYFESLRGT